MGGHSVAQMGSAARGASCQPCALAYTACTREVRPSLRSRCWTWIFTVVSAIPSSRPFCCWRRGRSLLGSQLARRQSSPGAGGPRRVGRSPPGTRTRACRHLAGDHALACHRAADRGGERVALDGLEQVAAGAAAQRRGKVGLVLADREHQHARARGCLAQRRQRIDAAHAGQVVVEQDQVGLQRAARGAAPRRRRPRRRRPGTAPARQQRREPAAKQVWSSTTRMRIAARRTVIVGTLAPASAAAASAATAPPRGGGGASVRTTRCRAAAWRTSTAAPMRRRALHDAQAHVRLVERAGLVVEADAVVADLEAPLVAAAARRARPGWGARACLRTLDSASCRMCSTCTCSSGASGRAWPCTCRLAGRPLWCSNLRSMVCSAGSMSSPLLRVRKCSSSSRTSP